MQSITLLSDANLASTKENFPALVHAFEYASCDFNADTITCLVSGVVANFSTGSVIDNSANGVALWAGGISSSITGTLTSPGTNPAIKTLIVCSGLSLLSAAKKFEFGDPETTLGIGIDSNGANSISSDDGYHTLAGLTASASPSPDFVMAVAVDWSGDASTGYMYDSGLADIDVQATVIKTGDIIDGIATVTQRLMFPSTQLYGAYIFNFTAFPADLEAGLMWMAHNKGIPPFWQGLT